LSSIDALRLTDMAAYNEAVNNFYFTTPISGMLTYLGLLLGILASTWLAGRFFDKRDYVDFGLHFELQWFKDLAAGILTGALLMALVFGVEFIFGFVKITGTLYSSRPTISFGTGFAEMLFLFFCVGIYEELFFRGYLIKNLAEGFRSKRFSNRTTILIAYLISSVVFAAAHMSNVAFNFQALINLILAGFLLGLAYIWTGELAFPIGLHMAWNFFQGPVFGFQVSGTIPTETLLATQVIGPEWVTGGAFGPEGGLIGSAAILFGIFVIFLYHKYIRKQTTIMDEISDYVPRLTPEETINKDSKRRIQ
ncbi:MAG: CPBP family intramembrane metalloprotease, partial [Anaerolineaceae bacterium]|nr:CPBP family intramembrane metalloprotease [Anaerolineaceae bacterium]